MTCRLSLSLTTPWIFKKIGCWFLIVQKVIEEALDRSPVQVVTELAVNVCSRNMFSL